MGAKRNRERKAAREKECCLARKNQKGKLYKKKGKKEEVKKYSNLIDQCFKLNF